MSYSTKISLLGLIAYSITATTLFAQVPCINGKSGIYPCKDVTFLSNVTAQQLLAENTGGVWLNDIWGWVDDQSQKEYAIVAMSNGTTFVDVSDPLNPIVLGILPEHASASTGRAARSNSIWRDVKTFKNHAFIVSEDTGHGMQVFDLTKLRDVKNAPEVFPETAHYAGISNAHNIVINEATGFAYAVGATKGGNCRGGELHIIDINDPLQPVYAGCFDSNSYTHDAQCIIYDGPDTDYTGKEICFNANEDRIKIVDVTDKSNPTIISTFFYSGAQYAHQGWLSDDRKFFISNDELDELNNGTNTKTFAWDVQDLDKPVLISTYTHSGNTIDHNLYCKDTLIYQSNYTAGLRILNLKDVETSGLEEVAYFDTYPKDNNKTFNGTWSNYPFLPSGNIIVSDIINGLFVLKYNPNQENVIASIDSNSAFVNLYPNPANNFIKLQFASFSTSPAHINIYDFSGKLILESNMASNNEKEVSINTSSFKKGIYHIRIAYGNEIITKKVVIY
jgi:choice-of-anchor B domain-containing protein